MKNKFAHLGRVLTREEAKLITGGLYDGGGGDGKTCSSTCWDASTGGNELGSVTVDDCNTHAGDCKTTYPSAVKATCACS